MWGGMEGVGVIGDVCGVGGLRQVSPHMWESGFLRKTFFSLRYKVTFLSGSLQKAMEARTSAHPSIAVKSLTKMGAPQTLTCSPEPVPDRKGQN